MPWIQKEITLPPFRRGCHLITDLVLASLAEIKQYRVGLLHIFIQHTSASLAINENADRGVLIDMEMALNKIAPEDLPYVHTIEGPDDMPAHVKAALVGSSVSVPVADGRFLLGTWQGVYLLEHRDRATGRRLVLTLQGE